MALLQRSEREELAPAVMDVAAAQGARLHKVVLLGGRPAGKTSLLNQFAYQSFNDDELATIGVDFLSKTIYMENSAIRLQMWDTAGHERFYGLIPSYIRDTMVAVIVYDLTDRKTFQQVPNWVDLIRGTCSTADIIIVGNKADLQDQRQISTEEGQKVAQELRSVAFLETSAKTGSQVQRLFRLVAETAALPVVSRQPDKVGSPSAAIEAPHLGKVAEPEAVPSAGYCGKIWEVLVSAFKPATISG